MKSHVPSILPAHRSRTRQQQSAKRTSCEKRDDVYPNPTSDLGRHMQGPKRREADLLIPSTDTHNHQDRPKIAVQRIARSQELSASLTHVMHKGTLTISVLGHVRVIHLSSTNQIQPIRSLERSGIVLENCYDLSVRCRWIIFRPFGCVYLAGPWWSENVRWMEDIYDFHGRSEREGV